MNHITEKLTQHFQQWEPTIHIDYEEFYYKDELTDAQIAQIYLANGVKTVDEVRAELGMKPLTTSTPVEQLNIDSLYKEITDTVLSNFFGTDKPEEDLKAVDFLTKVELEKILSNK